MLYSRKNYLDRRNSVMAAVKKELKANNAYVAPEVLQQLSEAIDTSKYYSIEVIREAEAAAKRLQIKNHLTEHSWAGDDGNQEEAQAVFGEIKFGEDYFYEYFDNGNSTGAKEHCTNPEFDVNKPFAFIVDCHDWRDWNRDCCNYDNQFTTIVIYTPETIIDEEAYEAIKNAELGKICQLRESKYNLPKAE